MRDGKKVELIRKLVLAGRGEELWMMTVGESKYSRKDISREVVYPKEFDRPNPHGHVASFAFEYLLFSAKYGVNVESVEDPKGIYQFSNKEEFEMWLKYGAPGLFLDELEDYLDYEPLES